MGSGCEVFPFWGERCSSRKRDDIRTPVGSLQWPEEIAQLLGKGGPSQSVCRALLVPGRMVPVEDLVNAGVASRSLLLKSDQLAR
jgi:hypothetical protein